MRVERIHSSGRDVGVIGHGYAAVFCCVVVRAADRHLVDAEHAGQPVQPDDDAHIPGAARAAKHLHLRERGRHAVVEHDGLARAAVSWRRGGC